MRIFLLFLTLVLLNQYFASTVDLYISPLCVDSKLDAELYQDLRSELVKKVEVGQEQFKNGTLSWQTEAWLEWEVDDAIRECKDLKPSSLGIWVGLRFVPPYHLELSLARNQKILGKKLLRATSQADLKERIQQIEWPQFEEVSPFLRR